MSGSKSFLKPLFATILLAVASAPLFLALAENSAAHHGPQRPAHVELQNFQFNRVRAALALTLQENAPGMTPSTIMTHSPAAPGYIWRLSGDVQSAPRMMDRFEADPVRVSVAVPVQPSLSAHLVE